MPRGRRIERRFHLHDGELHPADDQGRCAWRGFHASGIDLVVTRKGVELGGWYDHFVGVEGGLIPWAELDRLRAEVMPPKPERRRRGPRQWERGVTWTCRACGAENRPRADVCKGCGRSWWAFVPDPPPGPKLSVTYDFPQAVQGAIQATEEAVTGQLPDGLRAEYDQGPL